MDRGIKPAIPQLALADFCRRRGIRRLLLFGSVLRDDFSPQSDADVLVEFQPGRVPGLIGLGTLAQDLEPFFDGKKIDLHTLGSLNPTFRQQVLRDAEVQFDDTEG